MTDKRSAEKTVRDIRRATRRHYSAEEKIRVVLEGLRGEDSIAEMCCREGINSNVYYRWSKIRAYLSGKRSDALISIDLLSTTGCSVTRITELTALRIASRPQRWSGTRFRWITALPSLNWPWTSRHSLHVNWRLVIPINRLTLSRNPPFTGY